MFCGLAFIVAVSRLWVNLFNCVWTSCFYTVVVCLFVTCGLQKQDRNPNMWRNICNADKVELGFHGINSFSFLQEQLYCHSAISYLKANGFKAPLQPLLRSTSVCFGSAGKWRLPASSCCRRNILERLVSEPLVPGCCSLRVLMINWECYCPLRPSCLSSAVDPLWCLWATKQAPFMC